VPDEPLDHVLRAALPWRDGPVLTECGKLPADGMPVLTVPEFVAKVKRQGQQRASMSTCMTCWNTAQRHHTSWDADPVAVISREAGWARTWSPGVIRDDPTARLFHTELLAIAELISRHRDEFDGLVDGIGAAPSLDDRRRDRRRRRNPATVVSL
jgi:hypothetical protein